MYTLVKHSAPGFSLQFPCESSALTELQSWCCSDCLAYGGNSLSGLLGSSCGCEFSCAIPEEAPLTAPELMQLAFERQVACKRRGVAALRG